MELNEGARHSFLEERCAGNPRLRREVESLLKDATAEDSPLEPGAAASPGLIEILEAEALSEAEGTRIGRYRVLRLLGRGGMGVVYLAERADGAYRQQVALKRIRLGAGREAIERFTRERQILASLEHPGIARLLDGGVDAREEPFLVVEYVEGLPLIQFCVEQEVPLVRRLELFCEVCQAVSAAHRQLVVHRDLKPSNILVTTLGEVKLLDFGIAKLLEEEGSPTLDSAMTPQYASPEQFRAERVTVGSDVYQLGLLAYELVCGEPPYRVGRVSPAEAEELICVRDPPPPSARALAAGAASAAPRRLEGDLDAIVLKALRKEPALRYASVDSLRQDVERHLVGLPVAARPATLRYRGGKFLRRHAAAVTASALAAVAVIVVTATFTWRLSQERDRTREQARQAIAERDRAERRGREAEEVSEYLVDLFEASDPRTGSSASLTARELLERGAVSLETKLRDQPMTRARLQYTIGRIYDRMGIADRAEELLVEAQAVQEGAGGDHDLDLSETLERLGVHYLWQGRRAEGELLLARALEIKQQRLGPLHPRLASAYNSLATSLLDSGRLDEAEAHFQRALEIYSTALGESATQTLLLRVHLARIWDARGDRRRAKRELEEVVEIFDATLAGRFDANHLVAMGNLAVLTAKLGDPLAAETLFERVASRSEEAFGPDHPELIIHWNNLGITYASNDKPTAGRKSIQRALDLARQTLDEDHPWIGSVLVSLAGVDLDEGDFALALEHFRQALAIREAAFSPDHPGAAPAVNGLGEALMGLGRMEEARESFERSLALLEGSLGDDHSDLAAPTLNLARLYDRLGETSRAEPLYLAAAELVDGLDPGSADRLEAVEAYVDFLRRHGRESAAAEAQRRLGPSD